MACLRHYHFEVPEIEGVNGDLETIVCCQKPLKL